MGSNPDNDLAHDEDAEAARVTVGEYLGSDDYLEDNRGKRRWVAHDY
jgi:hypothetical protein